ncbi:MAG: hypothetical protein J3Q66DRAFT_137770 [Benniella sp.]|nr:MAG: hypothetical protein J3Q66DRAFT_137770 [Benniella sp.]
MNFQCLGGAISFFLLSRLSSTPESPCLLQFIGAINSTTSPTKEPPPLTQPALLLDQAYFRVQRQFCPEKPLGGSDSAMGLTLVDRTTYLSHASYLALQWHCLFR